MYFLLETAEPSTMSLLVTNILPFVFVMLAMYFLLILPQKKKDKALQDKRNSIEIGDGVITAGGIVGRVISIKEDTVVVETATSKMRFKRWAISEVEKLKLD